MPTALLDAPVPPLVRLPEWPGYVRLMESPATPSPDGFQRSWIQYMPMGEFYHPEYHDLDFRRPKLAEFKRNFDTGVRGIDLALDTDHKAGEAPGWVERMEIHDATHLGDPALSGRPAGLYALVKWTPLGVQLLKEQRYKYFSPEFGTHFNEVTKQKTKNVLLGGALTNRPFLKTMDAVTLSEGVSHRSWAAVNKSQLPRSAFLIRGDPSDKSTWKLPVYEGAGPRDADGHYTKRGPLNINAVRAALAAIGGARTGKAMAGVPGSVRTRLQRWLSQYGAVSQQHSEHPSDPLSPLAPAIPARSTTHMAKSQVALPLADDEEDNSDEGQTLDEATFQAEQQQFAQSYAKASAKGGVKSEDDSLGHGEELADQSAQDEMEYADGADGEDGDGADAADDGVDEEEDTHPPVTTPKKGHKHGKYAFHTHSDDADHSDAALADESEKMSERAAARKSAAKSAVSLELGELAALLSEGSDDTSVTLDDVRAMKAALRQLAEERVALREQQYQEEVRTLSEKFVRTIKLPVTPDNTLPKPYSVAPSKVFRQRFEAFMLSEDGRSLSDEGRNAVCSLIQTAYLRGAVPVTQFSERAADAATPLPAAQPGSRADLPARDAATSGAASSRPGQPSRTITLAEGLAQQRHGKKLNDLPFEEKQRLMFEASKQASYKGAERR